MRLLIGALAAFVIGGVLVAPVVLRGDGSPGGPACASSLLYRGRLYVARAAGAAPVVQAIAIGVGVTRGCGVSPANVDLRSLAGVEPSVAVGLPADQSSIYVRRGVCPSASSAGLLACLRRGGA
jgi:hypothetical protein